MRWTTMRRSRLVVLLFAVFFPVHLSAAFHLMLIKEVYGGSPGAPNARYVMLQMYSPGQNFVFGHNIIFYNAAGTVLNTIPFAGNVANGSDQATILIATTEAQALFSVTPD